MRNKPSQTQMYGEVLTLEDQYRAEIARLPRWTEDQRCDLIERARDGDAQAKEHLALSCVSYVVGVAWRYAMICARSSPCIEFLDLVQIGSITLLETMDKALACSSPIGYLCRSARWTIVSYCQTRSSA